MVRRDEADSSSPASRCSSPAGASPASVSAGAPSSRPQASEAIPVARAGCRKPLRRKPARGPQPHVKPAASTDLQSESRAAHVTAKATSAASRSGGVRAAGLGGVQGAARVHGDERNTRDPSAQPPSGQGGAYKPMVKSRRAQRESEGVVVLAMAAPQNAVGGKDPCFGRARNEGKCEGMADTIGPNHPDGHRPVVKARQLPNELGAPAERAGPPGQRIDRPLRSDTRGPIRRSGGRCVHAGSRRPSVSRVRNVAKSIMWPRPAKRRYADTLIQELTT